MSIPIVRLEVGRMKHTVQVALSEFMLRMDEDVQKAIEEVCTPEHVQRVLRDSVSVELDASIKREVESFFRYGDGRRIVADQVRAKLLRDLEGAPAEDTQP